MAKMFYTLEEAAEKLGVSDDEVKGFAADGKLQQFRDRDRLMFKRDEVDQMVTQQAAEASDATDLTGSQFSDSGMPLTEIGDTGAIDLMSDTPAPGQQPSLADTDAALGSLGDESSIPLADSQEGKAAAASGSGFDMEDTAGGTGISVFESGEIEAVDPLAQTQPQSGGSGDDTDLSLDSISSGSGLLDLTHEHDDTSLGVELDEIMPQDTAAGSAIAAGAAGSTAASAILEEIGSEGGPSVESVAPLAAAFAVEAYDPQSSFMSAGLLIGAMIALLLAFMAALAGLMGAPSAIAGLIGSSTGSVLAWAGGVLVFSLVLGGIGFVLGKSQA
jgi:excisionase family DNA binding protein